MKTIQLFCASPASTAICSSMDQRAIVRHGMRSIDRRLGHEETPKAPKNISAPCNSSHLPLTPSSRKSTSTTTTYNKQNHETNLRRKSSADVEDLARLQSSSRYLLSDNKLERDIICSSQLLKEHNYKRLSLDTYPVFRSSSSTRADYHSPLSKSSLDDKTLSLTDHLNGEKVEKVSLAPTNHQVVELRVSIHCKGCEGKLRKHISRMQGVTSYSIDLATKKVRVIGDVTPIGVLTSISKVKNAQFWPSPTTYSSSSSSSTSSSSPRISLRRY